MKLTKIAATISIMICSFMVMAAKPPGFTINGIFKGLPDGTVLEFVPSGSHDDEKLLSEATVKDGKFTIKGSVSDPRLFRITAKGYFGGAQVMIDQTAKKVTLTAEVSLDERNGNKFMDVKDLKVTGSPVHQEYVKKANYREALNEQHIAYNKRGEAIGKEVGAARLAKDSVKLDSLYKTAAYIQFVSEEKAFFTNVEKTFTELITSHKDSWWGPFLMLNTYSYFTENQKPIFQNFSKSAQESYYGQKVKEELFPTGFLNQKAPAFEAATNDKKDANLAQLIKENKYTLIDFWASWCQPCRKAIPALKELYGEMNSKGLQIVSISIDKKEADWLKAETEEQLKWPSYLDKGATSPAWKIRTIPAMFLVDDKGVVVAENVTIAQVRELMK